MAGRLFPSGGAPSILLARPVMVLGRATGCDVRFQDSVVSNIHCTLTFDGTEWVIEDNGSRNGTSVNRTRVIRAMPLKSGDTIVIASKFRLVIEYSTAAERQRFSGEPVEQGGDDRNYGEHGPATQRLEPHDKDVWSQFD